MKKFIGYILSWAFFLIGDAVSKPMEWFEWFWLYPVYNNLMCASSKIQSWSGANGPWKSKEEKENG